MSSKPAQPPGAASAPPNEDYLLQHLREIVECAERTTVSTSSHSNPNLSRLTGRGSDKHSAQTQSDQLLDNIFHQMIELMTTRGK
jgi:hypothetical protein